MQIIKTEPLSIKKFTSYTIFSERKRIQSQLDFYRTLSIPLIILGLTHLKCRKSNIV